MDDVFIAKGLSHASLAFDYQALEMMYKRLRAFEDKAFGKPDPRTVFNAGGQEIRSYGANPAAEWLPEGPFKGFRFDWEPLNALPGHSRYAIPAKPVPSGWNPVPGHPGVYLPDPVLRPEAAAECRRFDPPLLQRRPAICGDEPAIVIRNHATRFPRAEHRWPSIYTDPRGPDAPRYYIQVPKDYKGRIHIPADAERITRKQWNEFCDLLGDMYEPDWIRPEPVAVPADFVPARTKPVQQHFILAGASLRSYRDFEALRLDAGNQSSAFIKALGGGSYSHRGGSLIDVAFKTDPGAGWIRAGNRNNYAPDPSTPEGLDVIAGFASLPKSPNLLDLHRLFYPDAQDDLFPRTRALSGHGGLVVASYPVKSVSCPPPDARPLAEDMFAWLCEEQNDLSCGMRTPPMPREIAAVLASLHAPAIPPRPRLSGPSQGPAP